MLLSKAHLYSPADQLTSYFSTYLNHPARLDIVRELSIKGPQNVHQIASHHPLSLSGVSQHIEFLREKALLKFEPQFPFLLYNLDREKFEIAKASIISYLNEI